MTTKILQNGEVVTTTDTASKETKYPLPQAEPHAYKDGTTVNCDPATDSPFKGWKVESGGIMFTVSDCSTDWKNATPNEIIAGIESGRIECRDVDGNLYTAERARELFDKAAKAFAATALREQKDHFRSMLFDCSAIVDSEGHPAPKGHTPGFTSALRAEITT